MMRFEWEFQGATPDSTLIEWKASGRRVKRGLYRSATGIEFNADINGAIGIARKAIQRGLGGFPHERLNQEVAEQYEFQFDPRRFARGVLTMPRRVRLWDIRLSLA